MYSCQYQAYLQNCLSPSKCPVSIQIVSKLQNTSFPPTKCPSYRPISTNQKPKASPPKLAKSKSTPSSFRLRPKRNLILLTARIEPASPPPSRAYVQGLKLQLESKAASYHWTRLAKKTTSQIIDESSHSLHAAVRLAGCLLRTYPLGACISRTGVAPNLSWAVQDLEEDSGSKFFKSVYFVLVIELLVHEFKEKHARKHLYMPMSAFCLFSPSTVYRRFKAAISGRYRLAALPVGSLVACRRCDGS